MTELKQEVRAFKVEYSCDQGDGGTMVYTDIDDKYSPKHQHRCSKCGGVDYFREKYPCIRYERVEVASGYRCTTIRTPMTELKTCTDEEIKMIDDIYDKDLERIAAERLARLTPDTKFFMENCQINAKNVLT